jgi:uncharacterized protein with HEPN domain
MRDNVDRQVIERIVKYCERINRTIERYGRFFDTFENDFDYFQSVSMSLMQIGENAKLLSEAFIQNSLDTIPWRQIIRMRDIFAHHYDKMDIVGIWSTANEDIPALLTFCEEYIGS